MRAGWFMSTERWQCEQEYKPVRHFYLGRDGANVAKCACGANYRILPPVAEQLYPCPWCGQRTKQAEGPCADCLNDQQATSY